MFKQQEQPKPTPLLKEEYAYDGQLLEMNVGARQNSAGNSSGKAAFITDKDK